MALVLFSCRATGPFIMFEEHAKKIFEVVGERWTPEGAIAADELPAILEKLDAAKNRDKELYNKQTSYDHELRLREEAQDDQEREEAKRKRDAVNFYQRIVPLRNMIVGAIKKDEPIMWGRP